MQYRCRPDAMEKQIVTSFFSSQHMAIISLAQPFSVCGIPVSAPYKLTARLWVMSTNGERRDVELQRKVNILLHPPSMFGQEHAPHSELL